MKQLFICLSTILLSLGFFAFSPAPTVNEENYSEKGREFTIDELNEEVSSFSEFETRTYTSDKAVYNKRIRYWTDLTSSDFMTQTSIEQVIDRN